MLITLLAFPTFAHTESVNLDLEISSGITLEMLKCPATKNDNNTNNDFYISKYNTTQALYKEIMGEIPSDNLKNDSPVENISETIASEFCERLNEITSDTRPEGYEFKLPDENHKKLVSNKFSTDSFSSNSGFRVILIKTTTEATTTQLTVEAAVTPTSSNESTADEIDPASSFPANHKAGEKISIAVKNIKFPLICCPAGTYTMGSPASEPCHTDREVQKQINFEKEFFIGKYEITQGQYFTIMGNNPSAEIGDKLPVHNVSWSDAQKFCEKLNELTQSSRPEGTIFALPTEEQWEYACRSGYTTALNNGKNLVNLNAEDQVLNQLAWYEANSSEKIQTVGKKIANAWGIHDMHGNVWEWCSDKGADITLFGKQHNTRVARGGSFKTKAKECRAANHREFREIPAQIDFGFRIVLLNQN